MRTGNGKKNANKSDEPRASALRFSRGRVIVVLQDSREVSVPLKWYPTLQRASASQRARWEMLGEGRGFHWPELDLDLSTVGLVNGYKEAIPKPPDLADLALIRAPRRRSA